jgi:hypothetical protein
MQVRMKLEVLPPTVKYGEKTDLRPEMLGICRNGSQRLGRNTKKDAEDQLFVLEGDGGDLLRHSKDDVKIADGQELSLAVLDPLCSGKRLTFWAVPVPAAIEAIPLMATLIALLEVASQHRRATHLNCRHDAPLRRGHRRAMLLTIGCAVAAEDIRHFQLRAVHELAAQKY